MFFGGSNGFNAFFPENIRDNPYVPPVVITSFKIFNKPVPIGAKSVLKKAIPYADSLTLSYRDNVFSFEFAALSYANSHKNRYRYKLESFDPGWNEVGSKQRLATYTNLDPGKYVFRVQGSNSDGVWNEEGVSLPILITPPWWRTNSFRALCAVVLLALLWAAYQFRVRQLRREFNMRLEERVERADAHRARTARHAVAELSGADVLVPGGAQPASRSAPTRPSARSTRPSARETKPSPRAGMPFKACGPTRRWRAIWSICLRPQERNSRDPPAADGESPAFQVIVEGARQPLSPASSGRGLPDCARDPAKRLPPRARQPHRGRNRV